jgi:exopolyphosphatase / guanosine-5'-triphosphate,3'-diphosphate pyrophosphatase
MILAAIDIGSNAARLLISETSIYKDGTIDFNKINLFRVPLRLGFDVFATGKLSENKLKDLSETMSSFKHLMNVHKVEHYKVAATSALRDAQNSNEIIKQVEKESGIKIEIITGDEEASIIYENHSAENMTINKSHLYIDVGGGSTELTMFWNNKMQFKKSFNIGTIRFLTNSIDENIFNELKNFSKEIAKEYKNIDAIGSGGNINKVFNISKTKTGKPLSIALLKKYYNELEPLTVAERMHQYGFKEDRADVIVPALFIYTNVMKWAQINEIFVPDIGMANGLIKLLYGEVSGEN